MRRLFARFVIECTVAFALLALAIPALAPRTPPDPPYWEAHGFAACDLPCWAGIIPGITPFDQVPAMITAHVPGLTHAALVSGSEVLISSYADSTPLSALILPGANQTVVGAVELLVPLPFGILLPYLGAPACVTSLSTGPIAGGPTDLAMNLVWGFDDRTVVASVIQSEIDPLVEGGWMSTAWVNSMIIQEGAIGCESFSVYSAQPDYISPWYGFAPPWRYSELTQ